MAAGRGAVIFIRVAEWTQKTKETYQGIKSETLISLLKLIFWSCTHISSMHKLIDLAVPIRLEGTVCLQCSPWDRRWDLRGFMRLYYAKNQFGLTEVLMLDYMWVQKPQSENVGSTWKPYGQGWFSSGVLIAFRSMFIDKGLWTPVYHTHMWFCLKIFPHTFSKHTIVQNVLVCCTIKNSRCCM